MMKKFVLWLLLLGASLGAGTLLLTTKTSASTLQTADINEDGIWDDLEPVIKKYSKNEGQREALTQQVQAYQEFLSNPEIGTEIKEGRASSDRFYHPRACVTFAFKDDKSVNLDDFKDEVLNSTERVRAWIKFNANLSGGVYSLNLKMPEELCPFLFGDDAND